MGLFGTDITQEIDSSFKHDQSVAGGAAQVSDNAINQSISSGAGSTVTLTDAGSVQALRDVSRDALENTSRTAMGSLAFARDIVGKTQDLAERATASDTQQLGDYILPIVVVIAVVAAIYIYKKG